MCTLGAFRVSLIVLGIVDVSRNDAYFASPKCTNKSTKCLEETFTFSCASRSLCRSERVFQRLPVSLATSSSIELIASAMHEPGRETDGTKRESPSVCYHYYCCRCGRRRRHCRCCSHPSAQSESQTRIRHFNSRNSDSVNARSVFNHILLPLAIRPSATPL